MRTAGWATLVIIALVLAACGQATTPSPTGGASPATGASASPATGASSSPGASADSSATPSDGASAAPSPTASDEAGASATPATSGAPIKAGSIATVVTNDLRVRSKPSVSADSEKLTPLLDSGRDLYVIKGPVAGSGYQWYEVQPMRAPNEGEGYYPFGWVAAGSKDGEPWIKHGSYPCPKTPTTYAAFTALEPYAGLACFGRKTLTFPARLEQPEATCGVDIGWTVEPEWLGSTCPQPKFLIADTKTTDSFFSVLSPGLNTSSFHPGVDPPDWIDVTVTGHFDDKAAKTCKGKSTESGTKVPLGRDEIVAGCRATFVITGLKKRG